MRADRGADAQPALLVARGERQPPLLDQIARRDQAEQRAVVVDERQLLDLALDHQLLGVLRRDGAVVHDQPIDGRHAIGDAQAPAPRRTAGPAR